MANESHRSMEEIEPVHKVSNKAFEAQTRAKEGSHEQATALVHAHEVATVPDGEAPTHPAVKHSVGHYIERSSKPVKGLRRHRSSY